MTGTLQTVNGLVNEQDVDLICPHEHLLIDMSHEVALPQNTEDRLVYNEKVNENNIKLVRHNPYVVRDNLILDSVDLAVTEMKQLKKCGCNLLVDVTSIGLGRDVRRVREIAQKSGMHVVVGCGFFVHDAIPEEYLNWNSEQLSNYILKEIANGIDGTDIRPNVIGEIGVSKKIHPFERQSLEGAAMAAVKSKYPLYLHIYPWSYSGLEAVTFLIEKGVAPQQICVCHMDVTFDMHYLLSILKTGVYIEFDNFGKEFQLEGQTGSFAAGSFETDISRINMLKQLCRLGYTTQLMLANDVCLKGMLCHYGGNGYCHVFENIRLMLHMDGWNSETVKMLFDQNPRRFLFGKDL